MQHQKYADLLKDYLELTKLRVTILVALTVVAGYYLGAEGQINGWILLNTVIGTMLVAGGSSALNQVLEIEIDAKMKRTMRRPLPSGRISPLHAQLFGIFISVAGILHLTFFINPLTGMLSALTLVSYVFFYTPMKRKSSLSTLIGAIPGALPPVGGWAAARGDIGFEAWLLFAILFLWQIPHFLAIAWIYREDYARGGLKVLTVTDEQGFSTVRHIVANTVALLVVSLLPTIVGLSGKLYFVGAVLLGVLFLLSAFRVASQRSNKSAKNLLLTSVLYLPALFFLMSFDKTWL
ncbi:heme o synthase [candidate division KSB1 bacterium]|nr:heme o synthase [candidate division KSB1 bacterium]